MHSRPVTAIMNPAVVELPPQAALEEAMALMQEKRISAIVISEGGIPRGILTEHDLVRTVSRRSEVASLSCAELMHSPVICAGTEISDLDAFHLMTVERVRHLVICNDDGSTAGVLTESDLTQNLSMEFMLKFKEVSNVMSPHCLMLGPEVSVGEAAERMVEERHGAVVVVDEADNPLGILTERDIVRLRREHTEPWQLTLGEVMASPVVTVVPSTPLTTAVELMRGSRIRRLVVVDNAFRVHGMLSQHEVVQGLENDYVLALRKIIDEQQGELEENLSRLNEKALLDTILSASDDTLLIATDDGLRALYWNPAVEHLLGKGHDELRGCLLHNCLSIDDQPHPLYEQLHAGELFDRHEFSMVLAGENRHFEAALLPLQRDDNTVFGRLFRARDISHYKAAEASLKRSEELLSQAEGMAGIGSWELDLINNRLEWSDGIFSIFELEKGGFTPSYEAFVTQIHPDDRELVDRAFRRSVEEHTPYEVEHRLLMADGRIKYVQERGRTDYDEEGRPLRSIGTVQDISERKAGENRMQRVMEDTIGALAATLEKRDPYTAGHEQRVADIAVAIGREMGLDEERLRGIHLAGLVHDIGKVQVPAEILSKPTRLSEIEYQLIQVHSQAGYDILKGLDFPWPIADMVHQHHERLDGSGYPQGLSGEQMLLESKILAVADVVEAMSSHRPYRPAIGVEVALEEIERQRGGGLDAEAVDACLRLFRDKGFELPA